jgi:hypothetical protein
MNPVHRASTHISPVISENQMEDTFMSIIIADLQRRSAHIHWPDGIVPEHADLFAHNDIVIAAAPGKDLGASRPRHRLAGLVFQRPQRHGQRP